MNLIKTAYILSMFIIFGIALAIIYLCYLFYPSLKSIPSWIFLVLSISILLFWAIFIASRYNSHKINDKLGDKINSSDLKIPAAKIPKSKYVKICPKCGSTNVSFNGSKIVYDFCKDCGYGGNITPFSAGLTVFPEIKGADVKRFDKLSSLKTEQKMSRGK